MQTKIHDNNEEYKTRVRRIGTTMLWGHQTTHKVVYYLNVDSDCFKILL